MSPDAPVPRLHGDLRDPAHYRPLAAEETPEILQRLQAHGVLPDEEDPSLLAGMQPKIALALQGNALLRPRASDLSPSTHLLKTSAARPVAAARAEHLAMALAAACGLPAARTRLLAYAADGRPTDDPRWAAHTGLLVACFDRQVSPDGQVERLHQEDLAQVLGLVPEETYAHAPSLPADRRYGTGRIGAAVLPRLADPDAGRRDLLRLVLFSLAIGNWDLHAKNIAVLHADAGARIAPFYGIAPFYDLDPVALNPAVSDRLALPVGLAEHLVDFRPGDLRAFFANLGHPGDPAPMLDDGAHLL